MNFLMVDPVITSTDPESFRASAESESAMAAPAGFTAPESFQATAPTKVGVGTLILSVAVALWLIRR